MGTTLVLNHTGSGKAVDVHAAELCAGPVQGGERALRSLKKRKKSQC